MRAVRRERGVNVVIFLYGGNCNGFCVYMFFVYFTLLLYFFSKCIAIIENINIFLTCRKHTKSQVTACTAIH